MVINWYGENCFKIQNGDVSLAVDLPDQSSGLNVPKFKSNVYLKTITPWPFDEDGLKNSDFYIYGAGEYDIQGIKIKGFELTGESSAKFFKTAYVIDWEDISIGVLGHTSSDLPTQIAENFEELDVLIAPGGGEPFIPQEQLLKIIKKLNPKVFIPSLFKIGGLKRKAADIKTIASQFNGQYEEMEKLVFKKKDLADTKKTKMICLKV